MINKIYHWRDRVIEKPMSAQIRNALPKGKIQNRIVPFLAANSHDALLLL